MKKYWVTMSGSLQVNLQSSLNQDNQQILTAIDDSVVLFSFSFLMSRMCIFLKLTADAK